MILEILVGAALVAIVCIIRYQVGQDDDLVRLTSRVDTLSAIHDRLCDDINARLQKVNKGLDVLGASLHLTASDATVSRIEHQLAELRDTVDMIGSNAAHATPVAELARLLGYEYQPAAIESTEKPAAWVKAKKIETKPLRLKSPDTV